MAQSDQGNNTKRIVVPPHPHDVPGYPTVKYVELDEDEDVEWQWTHFVNGHSGSYRLHDCQEKA